jgi:hypothetical protein
MPDAAATLLALWNDVDPLREAEYNEWHAREHVPERLTVPGMLWALRYGRAGVGTMPRYPTLYGLRDTHVLDSAEYRRLLADPTPASRSMRPALRNIARWVCMLEVEQGIARFQRLDVRTALQRTTPAATTSAALLVATRIADAANLPWLAGGQAQLVEGDHLMALAHDAEHPPWGDGVAYARLPAG